jgi:hypothetical protein
MVSGRKGDHAAAALFLAQRRQFVVGAAELERAGALQRLRLEQDAAAEALVDLRRLDQGRFDDQAGEPRGGGVDVGNAGKRGHDEVLRGMRSAHGARKGRPRTNEKM